MNPVITPNKPANWLARQLTSPEPTRDGETVLAPEPRRRHFRHSTSQLYIESPVYGWVVDASEGGLRLESVAQLAVADGYTFRLRYRNRYFDLPGRVIWSRLDRMDETRAGRMGIYQAGVELSPGRARADWLSALERVTRAALGA